VLIVGDVPRSFGFQEESPGQRGGKKRAERVN
jgi:hypothetical protein